MPEGVVIEEVVSLNIHAQGVTQLRIGRRDLDPAKDRLPTRTSYYQWREGHHSPNSAACECRWSRGFKTPTPMQSLPALRTHAA